MKKLADRQNALGSQLIEESFLGRLGHAIEPAVRPLGWDWRIGVGAIASFPAREVIIATLGTIYSLGHDVDENDQGLDGFRCKNATHPDGTKVYNVPVALSIMVFFALCAQCAGTLMTIKRETNRWIWPVFTFVYMTVLAYVAALLTYQIGIRLWLTRTGRRAARIFAMAWDWQQIIALVCVAGAFLLLGRRVRRLWKGSGGGCGSGCQTCAVKILAAPVGKPLVTLDLGASGVEASNASLIRRRRVFLRVVICGVGCFGGRGRPRGPAPRCPTLTARAELPIRRWRGKARSSHMTGCFCFFSRGFVVKATKVATNFRPFSVCSRCWRVSRRSPKLPASQFLVVASVCAGVTGAGPARVSIRREWRGRGIWPNCRRVLCVKPLRVS